MSAEDHPRLRATDDDRHRVTAALSEAFSHGQLDYEELDVRTRQVWAARHRDELLAPLADLVADPAHVLDSPGLALRPEAPAPVAPRVTGEAGGRVLSFATMGMSEKRGNWLLARAHTSLALVGATVLDLRRARLTGPETTITALGLLGSVEILVPEDVRVLGEGVGVLGSFEVRRDDDVAVSQDDLPTDAPVVRVRGLGLLGAVVVRRVPRASAG